MIVTAVMSGLLRQIGIERIMMNRNFNPEIGAATGWKKGQPSPNAGGRPKARMLYEALRSRLGEVKADDPDKRTSVAEIMAHNLIEIACSKSPGAGGCKRNRRQA